MQTAGISSTGPVDAVRYVCVKRRLTNALAVLALMLLVAVAALWLRSNRFTDVCSFHSANGGNGFLAFVGQGHIELFFPTSASTPGSRHTVYAADAMPAIAVHGFW